MAGAVLLVQGTVSWWPNFSRGSWLCVRSWAYAPGAHLVFQAREDLTPHGRDGPATPLGNLGQTGCTPASTGVTRAMQDLSDIKALTRKEAFARRRGAFDAAVDAADALRDNLMASRLLTGATVISAYRPIRTEIDPTPLMNALHDAGHKLCVPVILGDGQPLEFHAWWPGVAMKAGAFGAEVPAEVQILEPDLLLVPLLAFDDRGWRLGYGGGFYDRTLQGLRTKRPTKAIGLAFEAQRIDAVPIESTDQPLDAIATEQGIIRPLKDAPS